MSISSSFTRNHAVGSRERRAMAGFTLIELLVVIAIIGILAGLVTAAAMAAKKYVTNAAIAKELKADLDAACIEYKNQHGEYPPDFAGLQNTNTDPVSTLTYQVITQNAVLRHLQNAFPQYIPGVHSRATGGTLSGWNGFQDDVSYYWGFDVNTASPATSLTFWLGGKPEWFMDNAATPAPITPSHGSFDKNKPIKSFMGFSAEATNPFDGSSNRIRPAYEFDIKSIGWVSQGTVAGLAYWAKSQSVSDKTNGPIVYFRAENGNYTMNGAAPPNDATNGGSVATSNVKNQSLGVWPAVDTNLSNFLGMDKYEPSKAITYKWINEKSFQIFSSGLDQMYSAPYINSLANPVDITAYPTGESYRTDPTTGAKAHDDITNFSGGTLESAMP